MTTKQMINIIVALGVAGIIFYLGETDTTLVLLAIAGMAYLLFANQVLKA